MRTNGLRAVPGGCRVNAGCRFVGDATRGDVTGAGEARELGLGLGLAGLVEREWFEIVERTDVVRPRPVLPVRVCPAAGRIVAGGGRPFTESAGLLERVPLEVAAVRSDAFRPRPALDVRVCPGLVVVGCRLFDATSRSDPITLTWLGLTNTP